MLAKHKVAGSTPVTRSNPYLPSDGSPALSITFATSNRHKFSEVSAILRDYGIPVEMAPLELREIQADTLEEIAAEKAREACGRVAGAAMVEGHGAVHRQPQRFPRSLLRVRVPDHRQPGDPAAAGERAAPGSDVPVRVRLLPVPGGSPECFASAVAGTIALECRGEGWGYDPGCSSPKAPPEGPTASSATRRTGYPTAGGALGNLARWIHDSRNSP